MVFEVLELGPFFFDAASLAGQFNFVFGIGQGHLTGLPVLGQCRFERLACDVDAGFDQHRVKLEKWLAFLNRGVGLHIKACNHPFDGGAHHHRLRWDHFAGCQHRGAHRGKQKQQDGTDHPADFAAVPHPVCIFEIQPLTPLPPGSVAHRGGAGTPGVQPDLAPLLQQRQFTIGPLFVTGHQQRTGRASGSVSGSVSGQGHDQPMGGQPIGPSAAHFFGQLGKCHPAG